MTDDRDIDVSDIPPEKLLAGLYNASRQQGMGFMHAEGREQMTDEQAKQLLDEASKKLKGIRPPYFDYLHGRVMKVKIDGKTLSPWLYNRDNGYGAAEAVVESIRAESS